jgi:signal transduction histidine kinase
VSLAVGRDAGRVRVAVSDNGEGIDAADLSHLFDRYERTPRLAGGAPRAGLGLAIARRIVELHGGALRVNSARGRGTEVSFDLAPACGPAAAPSAAARPHAGALP